MKVKKSLSILLVLMILVSIPAYTAIADSGIKVTINGEELSFDVPPQSSTAGPWFP